MNAAGVMEHEPRDAPNAQKRHVLASPSIPGSQFFGKRSLTQFLVNVLVNKIFALSVILGVGLWLLIIPAFTGALGANPAEKLLHQTGEIAIWTLGAVLSLSPLRVLFPRSRVVNALNRHRRAIGVSACVYGLIHFAFHLLYAAMRRRSRAAFSSRSSGSV